MAIQVVASWEAEDAASTVDVAVSGVQTGDLLVAITTGFDDAFNIDLLTPTDDQSNVWTERANTVHAFGTMDESISICDCKVAGTGPTTVTLRSNSANYLGGVVLRVTGHDATNYADQFAAGTQTADDPTAPSITCSGGNRLYVQGISHDSITGTTFDPPTGYTMDQEQEGTTNVTYAVASKVGAASTEAPSWITGASRDYCMVAGSYREALAAAGGPPNMSPPQFGGWGAC